MSLYEWMFRSRENGEIVLAQKPNLSNMVFMSSFALAAATSNEGVRRTASTVTVLALTWWALGELLSGVNPARRLIGAGALAGVLHLARG